MKILKKIKKIRQILLTDHHLDQLYTKKKIILSFLKKTMTFLEKAKDQQKVILKKLIFPEDLVTILRVEIILMYIYYHAVFADLLSSTLISCGKNNARSFVGVSSW